MNIPNKDTPRTNRELKYVFEGPGDPWEVVHSRVAKELERELIATTADRDEASQRIQWLEKSLRDVLRYFADLNGSDWIKEDSPGEIDMRQRARALQYMTYDVLHANK